jgi:hypothetical protein
MSSRGRNAIHRTVAVVRMTDNRVDAEFAGLAGLDALMLDISLAVYVGSREPHLLTVAVVVAASAVRSAPP